MAPARTLLVAGVAVAGLTVARAGISWSNTITEDPQNPTISDLGTSFTAPFSSMEAAASVVPPQEQAAVTKESDEFVEGAVKAFLNKQNLPEEEMRCIQQGSGEIGGNIGNLADQLGVVLRKSFGVLHTSDIPEVTGAKAPVPPTSATAAAGDAAMPLAGGEPEAGTQAMSLFYGTSLKRRLLGTPEQDLSDVVSMMGPEALPLAVEVGITINKVVKEMHELVGKCIHSDAKLAFEKAGDHALNMKYITGHFLANGADIVEELADSVMAYENRNATQFGADVGKALRKIFLSDNLVDGKLPEGLPGDAEIANVTEGFLLGFFGPGTFLDVHLQKDPKHPLHVDLQRCISQDIKYYQSIWGSTMYMFAQGAAGVGPLALSSNMGRIEFATMMALTLMELPAALGKCGISAEQEAMLMDAVKGFGIGAKAQVTLPGQMPSKDEMAESFASTLEEWSEHNWVEFGQDLGAFMQKSTVRFYPRKYSLTDAGQLRRQLNLRAGTSRGEIALLAVPLSLLALSAVVLLRHRRRVAAAADREEDGATAASQRGLLATDFDAEDCIE